nr:hypothetical protein [Tanacetum cinerariifolium]
MILKYMVNLSSTLLWRTNFAKKPRVTLGRLLPYARGLGFKPRREGFPSGAKKEWGLSPKAKGRVLHTSQLDVTVNEDSESDVEEVYDEIAHFMASKGMKDGIDIGNKSLYEHWKETMDYHEDDPYDDVYNTRGLPEVKKAFFVTLWISRFEVEENSW